MLCVPRNANTHFEQNPCFYSYLNNVYVYLIQYTKVKLRNILSAFCYFCYNFVGFV